MDRRPPPVAVGSIVGTLTDDASRALGLRAGIPVAGGTNDAFASYLGAGLTAPGDAYDPGGSAGGFGVYWHEPVEVPGAFVTPAPLPGLFSVGAAMAATGRALDWFRDVLTGGAVTTEALLEEAATTPPGADGVVFLPYLAGERSPIWDPGATGAEPMLAAGVAVTAMRACGGPARSETWNQIKADVTGFPVLVPAVLETAVLGSTMLGAVAIGACPDVPAAVRSMTRIERRLEPRAEHRATYDRAFRVYAGLYPALRPLLGRGGA
jgi:xylulokinase